MKLLTKAILKRFEEVGRQDNPPADNYLVIAKFFYSRTAATWYATEYDPVDRRFYGYVSLDGSHNDEWGYFLLDEFLQFRDDWGLSIERDLHWNEKPFGEIKLPYPA